eukprot:6815453-Pyramimonas_sp.AAC.1
MSKLPRSNLSRTRSQSAREKQRRGHVVDRTGQQQVTERDREQTASGCDVGKENGCQSCRS